METSAPPRTIEEFNRAFGRLKVRTMETMARTFQMRYPELSDDQARQSAERFAEHIRKERAG